MMDFTENGKHDAENSNDQSPSWVVFGGSLHNFGKAWKDSFLGIKESTCDNY